MSTLTGTFDLPRCPQCSVARPHLSLLKHFQSNNSSATNPRHWGIYLCSTCGGLVTAWSRSPHGNVVDYFPKLPSVSAELPDRPRTFLSQAQESLHAPSGAVMLAASAVDSMLKLRGLAEGSLYSRIEKAAEMHLITEEMSKWAHEVRLDANGQRHADEDAPLPTEADAQRVISFAAALGDFLFVLPARVERGLNETE